MKMKVMFEMLFYHVSNGLCAIRDTLTSSHGMLFICDIDQFDIF